MHIPKVRGTALMFDELFDDWRHICFQTGHFADFEQFKDDSSFVDFG